MVISFRHVNKFFWIKNENFNKLFHIFLAWTLNTQQANKLLATEMDFWRRSARKSRKGKVRNVTIRESMEVGKNIL
jgi:hypothetical protein